MGGGLANLEHLRSTSLFGLSSVMLIFDDDSENNWNRQKALERLSQICATPACSWVRATLACWSNLLVHAPAAQLIV